MRDWPKFAIYVQTCLENYETRSSHCWELTTLPRPVVELGETRRGLAHLKDLMAPRNVCFKRVQVIPSKQTFHGDRTRQPRNSPPPEIVMIWWLLYRCFIAICVTMYWNYSAKYFAPRNMTSGAMASNPPSELGEPYTPYSLLPAALCVMWTHKLSFPGKKNEPPHFWNRGRSVSQPPLVDATALEGPQEA